MFEDDGDFTYIGKERLDTELSYKLLVGCVVPRPIAWITTLNEDGTVNAAPFSSYNYVCTSPPMLAINIATREGEPKDTALNISARKEFVVNVVNGASMEKMHQTAANFPNGDSETAALDINLLPSRVVAPPRIAGTPIQMECRLDQKVVLGRGINTLYIGEVVGFHLSSLVYDGHRLDSHRIDPVARLGGPFYSTLGEIIHKPMLQRPPGGEGWIGEKQGGAS
ncbi:flavin reductase [Advenella kashmirensis W13003]|uniref:Flavin reductase n=1 Tax=Advenella kashmirensis W13003 TaxID=1424334 RepID=V8QSK9_9BURK|nr:flavin reductase family protein [Advenella kashmirensis]ETF01984.1 flavin reductase [Advenella kashmirensis W13003]